MTNYAGVIAGLTAFNTKAHIVRAAIESTAFQTHKVRIRDYNDIVYILQTSTGSGGYGIGLHYQNI